MIPGYGYTPLNLTYEVRGVSYSNTEIFEMFVCRSPVFYYCVNKIYGLWIGLKNKLWGYLQDIQLIIVLESSNLDTKNKNKKSKIIHPGGYSLNTTATVVVMEDLPMSQVFHVGMYFTFIS